MTVADFDGDGLPEVSSGTDLNHYLFEADGTLVWKVPQGILGNGYTAIRQTDGTTSYRDHHYQIYDQAVGNLFGDGTLQMAYGLVSDYVTSYDAATGARDVSFIAYRNDARALRADGSLLWNYRSYADHAVVGRCRDPIIANLDGRDSPEVLYASDDGHLYVINGKSGQLLWRLPVGGFGMSRGKILVDTDDDRIGELIIMADDRVLKYGGVIVGDVDASGRVDGLDLQRVAWSFGSGTGGERYQQAADIDRDGTVDGGDLALLAQNFGNPQ